MTNERFKGFEPVAHVKVLTDIFDEDPIPSHLILRGCETVGRALRGHKQVEEILFEEGITEIAAHAFAGFQKLRHVYLPQSLKCIGEGAFIDCPLLENPELPKGVRHIGRDAFGKAGSDDA